MSGVRARRTVFLAALGVLAVAAIAALIAGRATLVAFLEWIAEQGPWAALLLAAAWVPAAVLLVPGAALSLGTGFVLGLGLGTATVSIGSTAGAAAAFLVGRRLGRGWVRSRIAERARFRALDRAIERDGLKVVLLTRLSPLFPYTFLNYAFSLTGVSFRDFVLGSWIGMLPGTVLYVYLGSGARTLASIAAGRAVPEPLRIALLAAGIVATAAVAILLARVARRELESQVEGGRAA